MKKLIQTLGESRTVIHSIQKLVLVSVLLTTTAAFAHLLLYAAIFAVAIVVVLVAVSAAGSALHGFGV